MFTRRAGVSSSTEAKGQSLRALTWLNFFVADVQTGLGPLIAAYLAANGWSPADWVCS